MTKKYVDRWDAGCDSRPLLEKADREIARLRNIITGCPVCSELEHNMQPSSELEKPL